ncbi:MAG: transcriptional repressor [Desulfobacterales bacterium]|nr:transcriptional repressor [Desulfobacterales bacterium]
MQSPEQALSQYLRKKGIRQSVQRSRVLEIFLNTERHLTGNELYDLARKKYPKLGYATVYRAMKVIAEAGLAEEIDFGDGSKRYEHKFGHEHHDHLICVQCGRCVEAMNPQIEKLQREFAKEHGFELMDHKMNLFGICSDCIKLKK